MSECGAIIVVIPLCLQTVVNILSPGRPAGHNQQTGALDEHDWKCQGDTNLI